MSRVLEIPRDRWARGFDPMGPLGHLGKSSLLNEKGNQCCVGHYLTACGVPDERLKFYGSADEIELVDPEVDDTSRVPEEALWLIDKERANWRSHDAQELYRINDERLRDESTIGHNLESEQDREAQIAKIFAKHDVQVVFK